MRESLGKMHTFVDKLFKDVVTQSKVLERKDSVASLSQMDWMPP